MYLPVPLTISRNTNVYTNWWEQQLDSCAQERIVEFLDGLSAEPDSAHTLHWLMLAVFQSGRSETPWLQAIGLKPGTAVEALTLDIDPIHGAEGEDDGADVTLRLWVHNTEGPGANVMTVAKYVRRPWRALVASALSDHPAQTLAGVVDAALGLINDEIAYQDRLTTSIRQSQTAVVSEQQVHDVINEAADEVTAAAELGDTGTVDAMNLLANATLHRLFTKPTATLEEVVDACYDESLSCVLSWINE
ncbi:hypothetical protein [Mycolicibacterium alvei]|uniref:Uncharacterized protein n=1 Tax=Mycolicibacterium alvei TaxID=67081 RepID=A0A6N4V150_9MYCO|nr:hypothetical protein [Mycolicibacterium alvei]MCV7003613.1 hypothetical protein [Mycolicibacterium alvei]BBX30429.1 hypothetical protein MALV_55540 [Mycolicibacterium alvei]